MGPWVLGRRGTGRFRPCGNAHFPGTPSKSVTECVAVATEREIEGVPCEARHRAQVTYEAG